MSVLSFIIEGKDKFSSTMAKIKGTMSELGADWKRAMAGMKEGSYSGLLTFLMKVGPMAYAAGAGIKALGAMVQWFSQGVNEFAQREKFTIQLSRVTGSIKLARAELKALTEGDFALDDLFDEADIVAATIALKRLTGGVLGTAGDMKTIANIAAITDQSMSEVANSAGFLMSKLMAGDQEWKRYAMSMVKAGTISMSTVTAMQKMQAEGRATSDIVSYMWAAINSGSTGAVEQMRDTIGGLSKAVNDARGDAQRAWGEFFAPIAKGIDYIKIAWYRLIEFMAKRPDALLGSFGFMGALAGKILKSMQQPDAEKSNNDPTSYEALKAKAKEKALKTGMSADDFEKQYSDMLAAEKKKQEEAVKAHEEAIDRKQKADDTYFQAKATNLEKLAKLQDEENALAWNKSDATRANDATELLNIEARLTEIASERAAIEKDIAKSKEDQAKKAESLMDRDQRLREARMTPKERMDASKNRVADLTKQLAGETDPDKRLEISGKLMDEAEKQQGMKGGGQSLSMGDAIAKKHGQLGAPDPAKQQVDILKTIKVVLDKIEKKRGGMAP